MAVEGVLLYIGGGEAEHSAELLRMQNYFHFRGQEGWLTSTSGLCTQQPTPGAGVQLQPGPFLINSRFPGGAMQSYMGRIISGTSVNTTNVPPGAGRSDLVVMNIEDPYPTDGSQWPYPGAQGSDNRKEGPYAAVRVIEGVPAGTKFLDDLPTNRSERGWTCIPICRLDRPANTGTVLNSMIVPLRSIINPWAGIQLPDEILDNLTDIDTAISELGDQLLQQQKFPVGVSKIDAVTCGTPTAQNTIIPAYTNYTIWPKEADSRMIIPPYATHMRYYFEVIGAQHQTASTLPGVDANVYCLMRLKIGQAYGIAGWQEFIEPLDVSYSGCPDKRPNRPPILCNPKVAGRLTINPADRGKVVSWHSEVAMATTSAGAIAPNHNGVLLAVQGITSVYFNFEFLEGDSVQ